MRSMLEAQTQICATALKRCLQVVCLRESEAQFQAANHRAEQKVEEENDKPTIFFFFFFKCIQSCITRHLVPGGDSCST